MTCQQGVCSCLPTRSYSHKECLDDRLACAAATGSGECSETFVLVQSAELQALQLPGRPSVLVQVHAKGFCHESQCFLLMEQHNSGLAAAPAVTHSCLSQSPCLHAALLPEPQGACLGTLKEGSEDFKRVAAEAARTIPGREHGGNVDIKHLTRGCKVRQCMPCHLLLSACGLLD